MKNNKKIFLICTIRTATKKDKKKLSEYVSKLENNGNIVYYPARDTPQNQRGVDICKDNLNAIKNSDEVHIWYNERSKGTHFDMGMAFALNKKIKIVNKYNYDLNKKSYKRIPEKVL